MNKFVTTVALLLAVLIGGVVQVVRPLPAMSLQGVPASVSLPGGFTVDFPDKGQAAVGEESLGLVAETPNEQPVAIASLTKMMTAYLLLKAHPLGVGQDGPTTTLTAADVDTYQKDVKAGDSVARVAAGEKLTERQMLEALLLPSADNIATLIADQIAGSETAFVAKMNQTAHALGMSQTTYADAAGVNPSTVSTAHDQILMAQAAMQDRTFREIVAEPQVTLPVAGTLYNVDFMVGKQGISGIKTGSTLSAGSCFVGSYPVTIDGTPRILFAAVLGQQSLQVALTEDAEILHKIAPQFKNYDLPLAADGVGQLSAPWKQTAPLRLASAIRVFGYPGMHIGVSAKLTHAKLPVDAGIEAASLTYTAGSASKSVALRTAQAILGPDLVWRLHR